MTGIVAESTHPIVSSSESRRYLNIYLSAPFCRSKCHFCDWVQQIPKEDLLRGPQDSVRQSYIEALCREIRYRADELGSTYVPYVMYWGGGTASSLTADETERLFSTLADSFDLATIAEATIECSPDTATPERVRHYRELGFNRLSSGVQSFDPARLRSLGRRHTAEQSARIVEMAHDAGFDDVSIDIMCGFPDETADELVRTIDSTTALGLTHVSFYPFRPQAGTVMRRQIDRGSSKLFLGRQIAAYESGAARLREAGYEDYAMTTSGAPRCRW